MAVESRSAAFRCSALIALQLLLLMPIDTLADSDLPSISKRISQLEVLVLGAAPDGESNEKRLQAMETKLFGQPQIGSLLDRLMKIQDTVAAKASKSNSDNWPGFATSGSSTATDNGGAAASPTETVPGEGSPAGADSSPPVKYPPRAEVSTIHALPDVQPNGADAGENSDNWPTALPDFETPDMKTKILKVEVSKLAEATIIAQAKKAPITAVYKQATDALDNGNYLLAKQLYSILCDRQPKDPRYFYGAGLALQNDDQLEDAFMHLVIAWHLGNAQVYTQAASALIPELQKSLDGTFKLTYQWSAQDPESVLNAGTRLWKAGATKQAVQLFEWTLKNEPLCRGVAAYDLGAVAEYNGNLKLAHQYYEWAAKENARLQAVADSSPLMRASIEKSLNTLPKGYVEQAIAQVQQKLLRGDTSWSGWPQATTHPTWWSSEVCPLCGISRTSTTYHGGQEQLQ